MCEFCDGKVKYENHYGSFRISDFGKNKVISCEIDKCPPYVDCSCKDMNVFMEMIIKYCPMCGRKLSEVTEMTNKDIDHAKETIDRLTEELKHSNDYITQLKHDLDKTYNQLMEVEKDAQEHIAELESELEVKDNLLKIKNGLCGSFECLPSEPVSVANMLINAKEEYEPTSLEKALCSNIKPLVDKYSINDLEQIAEHLLVYCKHNRDEQD